MPLSSSSAPSRVKDVRDKLQIEWGNSTPHKLTRFADIRTEAFDGWEDERLQWIGLSREISTTQEDDDTALCAFLDFGPAAAGGDPAGGVVCRLENLDDRLGTFFGDAHVAGLLARPPSRITAFATEVG